MGELLSRFLVSKQITISQAHRALLVGIYLFILQKQNSLKKQMRSLCAALCEHYSIVDYLVYSWSLVQRDRKSVV